MLSSAGLKPVADAAGHLIIGVEEGLPGV